MPKAITDGCEIADKIFLSMIVKEFEEKFALCKNRQQSINRAGSCALVAFFIDKQLYILNVGDSRAVASLNNGTEKLSLTIDHKPTERSEQERIQKNGGRIYQT